MLPFVLYRWETSSLTVREEYWLRIFENRVRRRIFGSTREGWQEGGEYCIIKNLISCTLHQILLC
jgi:hypothetical protein